mmetsp:Transcript_126557/g.357933  ORF Transcript_126557/g.357933 Transcript_126557/m.357933 type:complete len:333 (-) Transcript_126557:663-1661(-)
MAMHRTFWFGPGLLTLIAESASLHMLLVIDAHVPVPRVASVSTSTCFRVWSRFHTFRQFSATPIRDIEAQSIDMQRTPVIASWNWSTLWKLVRFQTDRPPAASAATATLRTQSIDTQVIASPEARSRATWPASVPVSQIRRPPSAPPLSARCAFQFTDKHVTALEWPARFAILALKARSQSTRSESSPPLSARCWLVPSADTHSTAPSWPLSSVRNSHLPRSQLRSVLSRPPLMAHCVTQSTSRQRTASWWPFSTERHSLLSRSQKRSVPSSLPLTARPGTCCRLCDEAEAEEWVGTIFSSSPFARADPGASSLLGGSSTAAQRAATHFTPP